MPQHLLMLHMLIHGYWFMYYWNILIILYFITFQYTSHIYIYNNIFILGKYIYIFMIYIYVVLCTMYCNVHYTVNTVCIIQCIMSLYSVLQCHNAIVNYIIYNEQLTWNIVYSTIYIVHCTLCQCILLYTHVQCTLYTT